MNNDTSGKIYKCYKDNFKSIYKFFYYKTYSKEIAEDLSSEVFLTFAEILKNQKEVENIQAFLYGIAKNIFIRFLQEKYNKEINLSTLPENFEEFAIKEVKRADLSDYEDKLKALLKFIPEKQRDVLELRFVQKLTLSEICQKINKDMNYVKTTQKRGMKSIKEIVRKHGDSSLLDLITSKPNVH